MKTYVGIRPVLLTGLIMCLILIFCFISRSRAAEEEFQGLKHLGEPVFISGMNLAWIDFARDLDNFQKEEFARALDEVKAAGGNTLRWWLHTNASSSPRFDEQGRVSGLAQKNIENLQQAFDMAAHRNMLLLPVLFSFDLLQDQHGVNQDYNLQLVESVEHTEAYIENALIPMVEALKGHPALLAWEICNEPEGMTRSYGWTPVWTDMEYVQQFVNLLAGAIHRTDPGVPVTNGSWNFRVLTDIGNFYNYYRDDRLIEAGGDPDGTLDFYQVHYYPEHFREDTSPFHNPADHWELDKPILIGEFSAKGVVDRGTGFRPRTELPPREAFEHALKAGYAGALGWTWTDHDGHGGIEDAAPGLQRVRELKPEAVEINLPEVFLPPEITEDLPHRRLEQKPEPKKLVVDLREKFAPRQPEQELTFRVESDNPELIQAGIKDNYLLELSYPGTAAGKSRITVTAEDENMRTSRQSFVVHIIDPETGNLALLSPVEVSSVENEITYKAEYINDGLRDTRWSSEYEDEQYVIIDLEKIQTIDRVILYWEDAYAEKYVVKISSDKETWTTVHRDDRGSGGINIINFSPAEARYVKLDLIERATEWGFSLWEMSVFGAP